MYKINISIDDVSPHPSSSLKVVDNCKIILSSFPDAKFTLFVPVAYWRTMRASVATKEPLHISKNLQFCRELNNLPKKNFEICYHGYHHGIPGKSDNDEFENLNYEQALLLFEAMFNEVKEAGLGDIFKKVFRPPAWRMSPDAIKAASDSGIEILALSPDKYAKDTYQRAEEGFSNVVYYNVSPPFKELNLFPMTEIVYHACEWDRNYLSSTMAENLCNHFYQNFDKIEFCFMGELV